MKDDEPESSFQSPGDYTEYGKDATAAMMTYQRVRRPLMFHLLLVLIFFVPKGTEYTYNRRVRDENGEWVREVVEIDPELIVWMINNAMMFFWLALWSIPVLGIISFFRRLDDGFQDENDDQPVFTLKVGWVKPGIGVSNSFAPFRERLEWEWYWRTWMFYPALLASPFVGVLIVLKNGVGMLMDIFFLRCWDKWYYAINAEALEEKSKKRFIRGSKILELGKAAGAAPINFVKNKLGKKELEKDLVAADEKKKNKTQPLPPEKSDDDKSSGGDTSRSKII